MAERGKIPTPKSQKEISKSLVEPYDKTRGNPNDASLDMEKRGNQVSFKGDTTKPFSLGFTDIDEAIGYYINEVIKPTVTQQGIVQKVPFVFGDAERWKQFQHDGYYRDKNSKIMLPIIVCKRNNIEKNRSLSNKLDANFPHNVNFFSKKYSAKNTYDNFSALNNRTPKEQYYAVVVPDYVTITYDFIISTYYISQLNKLIEAINYASDSYWGNPERFKFRARVDNFNTPVEIPDGEERSVKAEFSLKIYGYVIPDTTQKQLSSLKKYSNKNSIKFNMEFVENMDESFAESASRTQIQNPLDFTEFEEL